MIFTIYFHFKKLRILPVMLVSGFVLKITICFQTILIYLFTKSGHDFMLGKDTGLLESITENYLV
jgi:hypothetical protein